MNPESDSHTRRAEEEVVELRQWAARRIALAGLRWEAVAGTLMVNCTVAAADADQREVLKVMALT